MQIKTISYKTPDTGLMAATVYGVAFGGILVPAIWEASQAETGPATLEVGAPDPPFAVGEGEQYSIPSRHRGRSLFWIPCQRSQEALYLGATASSLTRANWTMRNYTNLK